MHKIPDGKDVWHGTHLVHKHNYLRYTPCYVTQALGGHIKVFHPRYTSCSIYSIHNAPRTQEDTQGRVFHRQTFRGTRYLVYVHTDRTPYRKAFEGVTLRYGAPRNLNRVLNAKLITVYMQSTINTQSSAPPRDSIHPFQNPSTKLHICAQYNGGLVLQVLPVLPRPTIPSTRLLLSTESTGDLTTP